MKNAMIFRGLLKRDKGEKWNINLLIVQKMP